MQADLVGLEDLPDRLQGDRLDDLLDHQEVPQLRQRLPPERLAQQVRRAQRRLDDEAALIVGEGLGTTAAVLGLQGLEPVGVEVLDDGADMLGRILETSRDVGHFAALGRSQNHLRPTHLDAVVAASKDGLKLAALGLIELSNIQAHDESPRGKGTSVSTRGSPYTPNTCMAQVLILAKVIAPYRKRHYIPKGQNLKGKNDW